LIYLDSSAFLKSIWNEAESQALGRYLDGRSGEPLVSSVLLAIEARRTVLRHKPALILRTDVLLADVMQVSITDPVVESASRVPEKMLRSLDAIHLATALLLGDAVDVMVTYDKRLAAAAAAHEIATVAPC
jgi:predicted nucleic acid-binding protein